jgi:photosystem II stability/assembly factor-like uncharacterized protein
MLDDSDVFSIVIHPQRRGIVYASACSGAYRSADSASLWSRLPTPRGTFRTYVVAIDPRSPTTVYAGTSAGLLQSLDEGKIWKKIHGHVVKSIDFDRDNGRIYFASTTSGILASLDSGRTVIESNLGFVNRTWSAFAAVKGVLFTSSLYDAGGGLFRSQDAGATWSRPSQSEVTRGEGLQFIAPSPTSVFGATRSTLWRSNDSGKSWAPLANQPSAGPILALSFSGAGGLYLATPSGLHQSRDEGSTWKRVVLPINGTLRSVQISNDALFAVAGSTTAMSRDAGGSWTTCAAPPASVDWYGVAIKPDSPVVLAATSHGLLRSADDCNTWSFVRNGMEASTVMNVVVHPSRPQIFAVQRGRLLTSSDDGQTWRSISKVKGSESTPTILGIFPESADQIFALFPRQGIAQWKLHAVDPTTQ